MGENSAVEEFVIAVNELNWANCDSVVREAIVLYWGRNACHLFKDTPLEKLISYSTVLKRLKASSNLPIMN